MTKPLALAMIVLLFSGIATTCVRAIPTRDKQAIIEDLNAYGLDVMDLYPSGEPTTANDYYKLGIAYLFRNIPRVAAEQFRKSLELDAEHVDSLIGLAASVVQLEGAAAAVEYAEKALKIAPDDARVSNALGALKLASAISLEDLNQAEASFLKAISIDPSLVAPHMNLARLYMSMRKPEAAIKEYEAAIALQPENLSAHAGLASAYLILGSLDMATGEVEKIVELSPDSVIAHNTLGELYARTGQHDKALERFQKAVEIEPTYAAGYRNMGRLYVLMGIQDKAIEEFKKALSYRPNYGEAHSGLGDAYITKGMTQEAIESYKEAIKILPMSALVSIPAYNNLAYIYAEQEQDLDKALSLVQKAQQLAPEHPDIADTIGWIYYKKELYDEALPNLQVAAKGSPDNPIIRYHLGAAYYHLGAKDEALAELETAFKMSDKFEGSEDARRLLTELRQ